MADEPVQLRKLIVTGKSADGSHSIVATMFEPADHIDLVHAYLLHAGYSVENPNPDVHVAPESGEVAGTADSILHPAYAAHKAYLDAIGVTDIAAHVAALKEGRA